MFENNDFLTPFVPIQALDDQTITDNLLYRDYGLNVAGRGQFIVNEFIHPISKFMFFLSNQSELP